MLIDELRMEYFYYMLHVITGQAPGSRNRCPQIAHLYGYCVCIHV